MIMGRSFTLLFATLFLSASAFASKLITGAGSSFVFPLMSQWASTYKKIDTTAEINYNSIGSGAGIQQFLAGTVDFGASDAPMADSELKVAKKEVLHIPVTLGAVVITYNLPKIKDPLKLTADVVADMFLGKIVLWSDKRIAELNPRVKLPADLPIFAVRRSDGSGTTAIFTDYLAKVSPEWKTKVGSGKTVNFPAGVGGKGNEGVAGLVKNTPGSVGYVEFLYAKNNKLPAATLRNKAGNFIVPSPESVSAAGAGVLKNVAPDLRFSLTDTDDKDAYPISGATWMLIYREMNKDLGEPLTKFVKWSVTEGQKMAAPLGYAPLPAGLVAKIQEKIATAKLNMVP